VLKTIQLLLPALLPSWNFFDIIAPSPRIQYALLNSADASPTQWLEFRPRPHTLSFAQMLGRLLWNPRWNESLFVMSCAERIYEDYTPHSEDEILKRIARDLVDCEQQKMDSCFLQFRLVFISRHNDQLEETIEFESRKELLNHLVKQ